MQEKLLSLSQSFDGSKIDINKENYSNKSVTDILKHIFEKQQELMKLLSLIKNNYLRMCKELKEKNSTNNSNQNLSESINILNSTLQHQLGSLNNGVTALHGVIAEKLDNLPYIFGVEIFNMENTVRFFIYTLLKSSNNCLLLNS